MNNTLLKQAINKVLDMSDVELKSFLGIFEIDEYEPEPITSYKLNDLVEITSFIPGIGNEFCGELAIIYDIFESANKIGLLVHASKHNGRMTLELPPTLIRKVKK